MNPIAQGLALGYSAQKLLGFISKAFPALSPRINQARSQGHSIEQILGFISKTMETNYPKGMSQPEIHAANAKKQETLTKHGLTALGGLAGTMALRHALPNNISQMLGGGNNPNQQPNAQIPQQNTMQQQGTAQGLNLPTGIVAAQQNVANIQNQPLGTNQAQQPPIGNQVTPNITQPQTVAQPQGIVNPREYLEKLGIKDKVDELLKLGNAPESVAAALNMKRSGEAKIDPELLANIDAYSKEPKTEKTKELPIEKKQLEEIESIAKNEPQQYQLPQVSEYSKERTDKEKSEDYREFLLEKNEEWKENKLKELKSRIKEYHSKSAQPGESQEKIDELRHSMEERVKDIEYDLTQEKPTINKGSVASSPQGIGEIKELRNGQALIDVDGKLHKVKEEELEASPIPEKELDELYDDLIKGIEHETGEDVSRMVQWAGYNPENNTLQFLPHTGKLYKYGDISPEDAALLRDILSTRKTSGENFIGAWKAGSKSPIGAALSKLIRKLQSERGGKGNEYEETHEPIYSAYEPAIQAKKKKKKK